MVAIYLPGLEDVAAPPGLTGRQRALWRLSRDQCTTKRHVLEALFEIAHSRNHCHPTTAAIRSKMTELGYRAPTADNVNLHLRQLQSRYRLIRLEEAPGLLSRRRIFFLFDDGADRRRPGAPIADVQGRRSPTEPSPQVAAIQPPAPEPVSAPLTFEEGKKTSTLAIPPETKPEQVPARVADIHRRLEAMKERAEVEASTESPAPVATAPAARTFTPPTSPHIETVDRLRRLADPCGPEAVEAAAQQVAQKLNDLHSLPFHRKVCERVRSHEIPVKVAVGALRQAESPSAKRPAAVYAAFLKEHAPPARPAQKPTPGASCQASPGAGSESAMPHPRSIQSNYTQEVNLC